MPEIVGFDPAKAKHVTCNSCGSVLQYHAAEVKERSGSDISGVGWRDGYVDCPKCSNEVTVWST